MHKLLQEVLELKLRQNPAVAEELPLLEKKVVAGQTAPYAAAKKIIDLL
jgi:LAO/AO transport system kinase